MKILLTILFLSTSTFESYSQIIVDSVVLRQRIFNEIKGDDQIVDSYLSFGKKADSLFRHISLATAITYFEDSSYTIKYYSFYRIMELNDSLAFEYVKGHIKDSTQISHQSSCMNSTEHFNELIGLDHKTFINYKYSGLSFTMKGHSYLSLKADHKKRKKKMTEVDTLFLKNGLTVPKVY